MLGPKVSQHSMVYIIKLPLPAGLLHLVHPTAISSPGKLRTCTRPSTWSRRKCFIRPDNLIPLLHGPVLMFTCPLLALSMEDMMGILTGLQLCSPICSKLWCTLCSDTFLSCPNFQLFSAIWVTVALLCDWTRPTSHCSPHASMSLGCRFTNCPSLHHFW